MVKMERKRMEKSNHSTTKQQNNGKTKPLVKDILAYGDLLLIANKGCGKTNTLMQLARAFREQTDTRTIIFETFPKWMNEFDTIPFIYVRNDDVIQTDSMIQLNEEDYFVRTKRDYCIRRGNEFEQALKNQKDLLFTMEIEDTDRISFFIASVIYSFYRKHYLTAYKYGLNAIKERIIFVCEESQNLFDSSIISKKLFNKLRKMYSETRNLKLHFVMASQRLQDLNTKIRGRTRMLIGQVNIDDYDLKISRILRHSKHRNRILTLPIGTFLFAPTDSLINFDKFKQHGKPYELAIPEFQYYRVIEPQPTLIQKLKQWIRK